MMTKKLIRISNRLAALERRVGAGGLQDELAEAASGVLEGYWKEFLSALKRGLPVKGFRLKDAKFSQEGGIREGFGTPYDISFELIFEGANGQVVKVDTEHVLAKDDMYTFWDYGTPGSFVDTMYARSFGNAPAKDVARDILALFDRVPLLK